MNVDLQKYFTPWLMICSDLYCPIKASLYIFRIFTARNIWISHVDAWVLTPRLASLSYIIGDVQSGCLRLCIHAAIRPNIMATNRWSE